MVRLFPVLGTKGIPRGEFKIKEVNVEEEKKKEEKGSFGLFKKMFPNFLGVVRFAARRANLALKNFKKTCN